MQTSMHNLHDLFVMELQDLYSAENQILKVLPKMAEATSNRKLKKGFEMHYKQTKEHVKRLEEIKKNMDIELDGKMCKGMEGLLKEGEELMKEKADPEVLDAGLIAAAQRVEHYEIAGYGTAIVHAKMMNHKDAVKLLKRTIDEEEKTDKELSKIAEKEVNKKANAIH